MTISLIDIALYSGALFILFIVPGPVWLGIVARALSGGLQSAWPLALGVVLGDFIWPILAIFGVSWVVTLYADFLIVLKYLAVVMFFAMGVLLIRNAGKPISENNSLTKPGMWAGFVAGIILIMGNPKAVLFYMGALPGFFDLSKITHVDIAIIAIVSALVPLVGNLMLAVFVVQIKRLLVRPETLKRTNVVSGAMLIVVAGLIALT